MAVKLVIVAIVTEIVFADGGLQTPPPLLRRGLLQLPASVLGLEEPQVPLFEPLSCGLFVVLRRIRWFVYLRREYLGRAAGRALHAAELLQGGGQAAVRLGVLAVVAVGEHHGGALL